MLHKYATLLSIHIFFAYIVLKYIHVDKIVTFKKILFQAEFLQILLKNLLFGIFGKLI